MTEKKMKKSKVVAKISGVLAERSMHGWRRL